MTKDRARYIMERRGQFGEFKWSFPCPLLLPPYFSGQQSPRTIHVDGITEKEWNYCKMIWGMMSSQSSFFDVIAAIAEGIG